MTAHILAKGNWLTASVNRMKAKPVPLAVYIKKAELNVIISKISEKDYVIKFILKTAVWKRCGD